MKEMVLPSVETVLATCKEFGYGNVKKELIEKTIKKIKSRKLCETKRNVAIACAMLWRDLVTQHFFKEDRRASTEVINEIIKRVMRSNGFAFDATLGEVIYISTRIVDERISFKELIQWIEKRIVVLGNGLRF